MHTFPAPDTKDLPAAPPLRRIIGPSFILLGMGLGSGEIILWPYLTSHYGLGVVWGILVGVTMQFFINMEVERYALIYGESIFVGFTKMLRWLPVWFILSTFFGFGWPGIGLSGATLIAHAFGTEQVRLLAIVLFLIIGAFLSMGKVLYKSVETLQKILIGLGVPFIVILTVLVADLNDIAALGKGIVGIGEGFRFLPGGLAFSTLIGTFLGALAYAGAGGNLNLTQSCYVRDKGYGMGAYAEKITGLFTAKGKQRCRLTGVTFEATDENVARFHRWWRAINAEHAIIFWGIGLFTMLTLSLLAYATVYNSGVETTDIRFVLAEAAAIGSRTTGFLGILFLAVTGIMLTATQLTVLDSTSRIITENILLMKKGEEHNIARTYYVVLWTQIAFGIGVFLVGFDQPLKLVILGAIINAFSMFVYCGLLLRLNTAHLARPLRPRAWRIITLAGTFVFFGAFCALTAASKLGWL